MDHEAVPAHMGKLFWFLVNDDFFILFLTVGFIYEWRKGALDWS